VKTLAKETTPKGGTLFIRFIGTAGEHRVPLLFRLSIPTLTLAVYSAGLPAKMLTGETARNGKGTSPSA